MNKADTAVVLYLAGLTAMAVGRVVHDDTDELDDAHEIEIVSA